MYDNITFLNIRLLGAHTTYIGKLFQMRSMHVWKKRIIVSICSGIRYSEIGNGSHIVIGGGMRK